MTPRPNSIIQGDCLEVLRTLPDECVDCVITSPPYWGLRDYGVEGQIGLEKTPEEYVAKMVVIFREIYRILKSEGTLWLNLGDSYVSGKGRYSSVAQTLSGKSRGEPINHNRPDIKDHEFLKDKDLAGIPWRVAFALQTDGWYLRQDIIWHKPNPMPESVTDRCTKSHEYIFLLTKSPKYYFDNEAIWEPANYDGRKDTMMKGSEKYKNSVIPGQPAHTMASRGHERWRWKEVAVSEGSIHVHKDGNKTSTLAGDPLHATKPQRTMVTGAFRNRRSVWTITTKPFKEAHFATFPEDLIVPMVLAGCPKDGIALDPFMGSGTTAVVAQKLGRHYLGIELNPNYIEMAQKRLRQNPLI